MRSFQRKFGDCTCLSGSVVYKNSTLVQICSQCIDQLDTKDSINIDLKKGLMSLMKDVCFQY